MERRNIVRIYTEDDIDEDDIMSSEEDYDEREIRHSTRMDRHYGRNNDGYEDEDDNGHGLLVRQRSSRRGLPGLDMFRRSSTSDETDDSSEDIGYDNDSDDIDDDKDDGYVDGYGNEKDDFNKIRNSNSDSNSGDDNVNNKKYYNTRIVRQNKIVSNPNYKYSNGYSMAASSFLNQIKLQFESFNDSLSRLNTIYEDVEER